MLRGASWSGNERNNCWLNLGNGRFADASAVSGLDFADDGRAAATVDWDGDGDLDLWLRNRTGPQLRFLRNDHPPGQHYLSLRLEGVSSNRDAVGARVDLYAGGRRLRRSVVSGDGYLAQSSRRLHFGLGVADRVERLVVRWPGGTSEEFVGLAADRSYHLRQGTGEARPLPPRVARPTGKPLAAVERAGPLRVLLKEPLVLPPSVTRVLEPHSAAGRTRLINLWAQWCRPCLEELGGLADRYGDLQQAAIDLVALNVDAPQDRARAENVFATHLMPRMQGGAFANEPATVELRETLDAVLGHVLEHHDELSLPTSLLVDPQGRVQMIYVGAVEPDRLLADVERYVVAGPPASRRSLNPGRWYFRTPRPLGALARELRERGREEDARFYDAVLNIRRNHAAGN